MGKNKYFSVYNNQKTVWRWINIYYFLRNISLFILQTHFQQKKVRMSQLNDLRKILYCFQQYLKMQQIRAQNKKLKELQQSCQQQLQKLKEVGRTHQAQIDTLLKFNERLLGIIENQFNTATKNKISSQLQIISEINQTQNLQSYHGNKIINKFINANQIGNIKDQSIDQNGDGEDQQQEQQQQIYNQEVKIKQIKSVEQPKVNKMIDIPKMAKLDRVFQFHNKEEQISINLSGSYKTNAPPSTPNYQNHNHNHQPQDGKSQAKKTTDDFQTELIQLKQMIKQYKEEFVDNSAEYGQICEIIKNDLLGDLKEFKKIQNQSKQIYQDKVKDITKLRNEIKKFKPTNELIRVMKKLNVPAETQKLLYRKIINKQ